MMQKFKICEAIIFLKYEQIVKGCDHKEAMIGTMKPTWTKAVGDGGYSKDGIWNRSSWEADKIQPVFCFLFVLKKCGGGETLTSHLL